MRQHQRFFEKYIRKLTPGLLILMILFIGSLLLFIYIIDEVLWEKEEAMDEAVFQFLAAHLVQPQLTAVMKVVTHFASARFLQVAYAVLVLAYLFRKNWKRALEIAAVGIGGFLINYFMKLGFRRVRPPDPMIERLENFSFPSGHATSAFIFYGLLAYLVWKTGLTKRAKYFIGVVFIVFSVVIGFSRVYLRVHYPSDVIAGFCIGNAWLIMCILWFERQKKKSSSELQQPTNLS